MINFLLQQVVKVSQTVLYGLYSIWFVLWLYKSIGRKRETRNAVGNLICYFASFFASLLHLLCCFLLKLSLISLTFLRFQSDYMIWEGIILDYEYCWICVKDYGVLYLNINAYSNNRAFSWLMMMMMMVMMMMLMMNCFCGVVDRRKANHCRRSSPSRISNMPPARFGPDQNLSSGLVEWSCAVAI